MSHSIRLAVAAALLGSFAVGPVFAQGATLDISCADYMTLTPEAQLDAVKAYLVATKGAEGSAETNAEIVSLLLGKCTEFPNTPAIEQVRNIPIAVQ